MRRKTLFLMALALLLPRAAEAQHVDQLFREVGLLGTWANDCAKPAGEGGNVLTTYASAPDGTATVAYAISAGGRPTVSTISSAQQVSSDRISYLRENQSDRRRIEVAAVKTESQIRVWS